MYIYIYIYIYREGCGCMLPTAFPLKDTSAAYRLTSTVRADVSYVLESISGTSIFKGQNHRFIYLDRALMKALLRYLLRLY